MAISGNFARLEQPVPPTHGRPRHTLTAACILWPHPERCTPFWQRFVFNAAQLDFDRAMPLVRRAQAEWEGRAETLVHTASADYNAGAADMATIARRCNEHAVSAVSAWWDLADQLQLEYSHPAVTYPTWWLNAVNYSGGPPAPPSPPSPPVPPRKCAHNQQCQQLQRGKEQAEPHVVP